MSRIKQRIETGFEAFARLVCKHRLLAILVVLLASAGSGSGIRNVTIDTSNESFLAPGDPVLVRYEEFREQFGRDDIVIIAVESDDLFTPEYLLRLQALHNELSDKVPHIANITSMINARDTKGDGDSLIVGDLLEDWPTTEDDFLQLRETVLANPLYLNRLISPDGRTTTIVIELSRFSDAEDISVEQVLSLFDTDEDTAAPRERLSDEETHLTVTAIQEVAADYQAEEFSLQVAGTPAVTDALKIALQDDMKRFIGLVIGMIALLLFIMFRSVGAVALSLGVVLLALVSTIGLMGHFGTTLKLPTVILPTFLIAVGVGAAVHLLEIFKQRLKAGHERKQAIVGAVGHSGLPILLTSLTTAAGLGSFAAAEVAPIAELGRYSAVGVMIAFIYTLTLVPAGLAALPVNQKRISRVAVKGTGKLDEVLASIAKWGVSHARPVVVATLAVALVSGILASQLRFTHDVLSWLPSYWPEHQATRTIDRDLGGTVSLDVIVDTQTENGLHDQDTLEKLDELAQVLKSEPVGVVRVSSTWSVADVLKEIHKALNENRSEYYRIPENPRLIPQEFLLFENSGSDDLDDLVDSRFRIGRFNMRVPWLDTLVYPPFVRHVDATFEKVFGGRAEVTVTGFMSILSRTLEAAIHSAAQSYAIAFVVITLMMIALIGRLSTGLISMIPNLAPIAITLALMQIAGIPLNLFTMLVGSIAIGLAVDDTVHFMHHFHRFFERTGNIEEAVRMTLLTSGRAMLATSIVLSTGFLIFCLATMNNLIHFGFLTGITILMALAANFVIGPALMVLRYQREEMRRNAQHKEVTK